MARKKGLLIAPEFPPDSFWSYKHIMKYARRKVSFPPLGLLTFAAMLPQDEWDFELIDLNVYKPGADKLHRKIRDADAVFTGAMNIQRDSLAELLDGPARGTDTPWVLGGPLASTYRNTILQPHTQKERILHDGLDYLVWGEAMPWIADLVAALEERPHHSEATPRLFIPERVLAEPDGSHKHLRDESIFKPLENMPLPRWDLVDVGNYRSMMIQATAGCRFRCNFCDIVQFNGGFARAKDRAAIKRELQAIYDTGFRGGIFTVDDNFVSEPAAMEDILEGMIEFQRRRGYPFTFFTQASIDLGKESLAHLLPLMKQAGFMAVFLGIENPDQDALKAMNKIQNVKTAPQETIAQLQHHGIEVYAGFIFGADTDTRQTADLIVDFVKDNGILSAMTGKLTPLPHTPLYAELRQQGRLVEDGNASNNIDETWQYRPVMSYADLQEGFTHILDSLFNRQAIYERARGVLERIDMHIFRGGSVDHTRILAVFRSFFDQGFNHGSGFDGEYFKYLKNAFQSDRKLLREVRGETTHLTQFWHEIAASTKSHIELDPQTAKRFGEMLHYAHDSLVRHGTDLGLAEIKGFVQGVNDSLSRGFIAFEEAQSVYDGAMNYLKARRDMFRFPGSNLVKAFELAIMGLHYETVVGHVLAQSKVEIPEFTSEEPSAHSTDV